MPLNLEVPISRDYKYQIVRSLNLKFEINVEYFFSFLKSYNILELEFLYGCGSHLKSNYICKDCTRLCRVISNILYGLFLYLELNLITARNPMFLKTKSSVSNNIMENIDETHL